MKPLPELKKDLKELITEGIDLAIEALENFLASSAEAFNDLLLLKSRYKECNKQLLTGIVSDADAQLEFNKIRAALLQFVDSITAADLQEKEQDQSKPAIYNGDVLYRIPDRMQKDVEVTCIVRLAFSKEELYIGLDKETHDVVKDLRISDVMGVELIDPAGSEAFNIRTYSEQVQFVEKGLPTEWLFYVKPLKAGTFPLILKISVIEIINGVERKRNVVLEEKVQIVAEPVPEEKDRAAGAGFNTAVAGIALSGGGAAAAREPSLPGAPTAEPAHPGQRQKPQAPSTQKRSMRQRLTAALPIALVLVVAVWALNTMLNQSEPPPNPSSNNPGLVKRFEKARQSGDVEALKQIVDLAPESDLAAQSQSVLDSLDKALWETSLANNDPQTYLDRFPGGQFAEEAMKIKRTEQDNLVETEGPGEQHTGAPESPSGPRPAAPNQATSDNGTNAPVPLASAKRKPIYPGCKNKKKNKEEACTENSIRRFVSDRFKYPEEALRQRIEGVVNVSFVVEKNGEVSHVKALNELGYGCEEAAVKLVSELPRFEPGRDANGRPVRVLYRLPVRFQLR